MCLLYNGGLWRKGIVEGLIYVTHSVKSRLKSQNLWDNEHQSLINTINFTVISIFDMTLLSHY